MSDVGARAAALRSGARLDTQQVATALGVPTEQYEAFEAGDTAARIDTWALASLLGVGPRRLVSDETSPVALDVQRLWQQHGPSGDTAALRAVTEWTNQDARLSAVTAGTEPGPRGESVASRGAPDASASIFSATTLPPLTISRLPDDAGYEGYSAAGRELADEIADSWPGRPGPTFNPWPLAEMYDVQVGLEPLGQNAFSETMRVGSAYAIVVNSDLAPSWRSRALTHALVHLAAGHVALGTAHPIADLDDDSIYACTGIAWELCTLVDHVVAHLFDEAGDRPAAPKQTPAEPRDPKNLSHWEQQEDVFVPQVNLRRVLGLRHDCLLERGMGESTWPPSLAHRWVAGIERHLVHDVGSLAKLAVGAPGYPTREQVELAMYRQNFIGAQLEQWNRSALGL